MIEFSSSAFGGTAMPIDDLEEYLRSTAPGALTGSGELERLLAQRWDDLRGASDGGMIGRKLLGRMERVQWNPPVLSFTIERHGATVLWSTRAELQRWEVDLETRTATQTETGQRQMRPMAARLDVKPLVSALVPAILGHEENELLKWYPDGSVRVLIGKVLPADSAVPRTLSDRRKRFRQTLSERLAPLGWHESRPNFYMPTGGLGADTEPRR